MGSGKPDLGSERPDLRPRRPCSRLGGGLMDRQTDGRAETGKFALCGIVGHRPLPKRIRAFGALTGVCSGPFTIILYSLVFKENTTLAEIIMRLLKSSVSFQNSPISIYN